jgi:NarL family two-component system response regulator LiaR
VQAPIRVMIVDDNNVFREGLELVLGLRSELEIVGSAEDGADAAEIAREVKPDVVLMDYRLPGMDGVAATAAVLEAYPDAAVVGLTATANLRERQALYDAGAIACLSKDDDLDEIVAAIRKAAWS